MLNYLQILCINASGPIKAMSHHPPFFRGVSRSRHRCGQALIEFAFVSIVMVTLFTVAFSLGLMLLQSMVTANAGATAGRILHHHPRLSPEAFASMRKIDGVLDGFDIANPTVSDIMRLITAVFPDDTTDPREMEFTPRGRFGGPLYDERLLILTREQYNTPAELPELNRLLLPNFIYDADRDRFRYPGAVVERDISVFGDNALTVLVPLTEGIVDSCFDNGDCSEYDPDTLTFWLPPLRICKISNSCNVESDIMPIPLRADGTFAITITFPAQAGALVEFRPVRDGGGNIVKDEFGNEIRTRVAADDSALTNLGTLPPGYTLAPVTSNTDFASLSTRGDYGLGELAVLDMSQEPFEPILVRPYRRVIGHTSTFRLGQRLEAMFRFDESNVLSNLTIPSNDSGLAEDDIPIDYRLQVYDEAEIFTYGEPEIFNGVSIAPLVATVPMSGKWRLSGSMHFSLAPVPTPAPDPHRLELRLYHRVPPAGFEHISTISQTTFMAPSPPDSLRFGIAGSNVLEFAQGDEIQIRVYQNSATSLTINGSASNWISLEGIFLRD